ncbi:hypothetical protein Tco_0173134 [Tanacetum coccineum]
MAIPVILISSNSSDESVRLFPSRIILFGTIPAEIPAEIPTISSVVHTFPHTSPFLCTNSLDSDTSTRPPIQDPYEVTVARWRSKILTAPPGLPRRPAILVFPGQPIPLGRTYRTQPNGVRKMLTARKRVQALPSGHLPSRYLPDHSSSDHFSSDDSSSDSLSDLSSDYSLDSPSGHSLPDSSIDAPTTISVGPSRKRCRSLAISVPLATPVPGALSPVRADLLPPRKRIRDEVTASDYDDNIDVDTAAAKAATAREVDVGVEVGIRSNGEDKAEEKAKSGDRGTIEIGVDRVSDIESAQREDNMRLPGMLCVERERVDSLRRHISYTQEELRQMRVSRYYDRAEFRRLETFAMRIMPTSLCARMTPAAIEEMIEQRVTEALEAYEANRNRDTIMESEDEHGDNNGDDHVNGNGGGNGNKNHNGNGLGGGNRDANPNLNTGGVVHVTRECTYQDFLNCQPLIFKGTEGVVGLTRWFEKIETVFSNCLQKYQVKHASCSMQNGALTWWNSHKRTIGTDAAYGMTWKELMKLMMEVYCLRNDIQTIEDELWNLAVKGNDLKAYT